jgi:hypothetical protein
MESNARKENNFLVKNWQNYKRINVHQRRQYCDWHIDRANQCHQISEEIAHSMFSFHKQDPS